MIGFPVCPECGGEGFVVTEHIRTVAEHHPNCDGGSDCSSICPVAVPVPELEQEHCPNPSCVEGAVITDELVEAGAKEIRQLFEKTNDGLPSYLPKSMVVGLSFQDVARSLLAAVLRHLKGTQ